MVDIRTLVRPNVQKLTPYANAAAEFGGKADIKLDANENPFGFGLNRYPDTELSELKKAFSLFRGLSSEQLIFGNGSDELIDLLIRAFCEPGQDRIMTFTPGFSMYEVNAAINNVEVIQMQLTPTFEIDLPETLAMLEDERLKLIFICSPNNPTGNVISKETIVEVAKAFNGLVIVDEAYIDFGGETFLGEKIANVFILQTFSKALGLAGARLGVGIGSGKVIEVLEKIKPPYNINALTIERAMETLKRPALIEEQVSLITSERDRLLQAMSAFPEVLKVYPSESNFLLVAFRQPEKIYQQLLNLGIVVRDRSKLVSGCLRITVGKPEENNRLLAALGNDVYQSTGRSGSCVRTTAETSIRVHVDLDQPETTAISTGIAFFDHMLNQIARHAGIGLRIEVEGDLDIDAHHSIEDTALALGTAFNDALGNRSGIERYGFLLPMDDCLAQVAIDFGGRPWLVWEATFKALHVGAMPTEMVSHFFKSFSDTARCNLNIKAEGDNDHHKIESIFKAFARAIKMAVRKDESGLLPSTKEVL